MIILYFTGNKWCVLHNNAGKRKIKGAALKPTFYGPLMIESLKNDVFHLNAKVKIEQI